MNEQLIQDALDKRRAYDRDHAAHGGLSTGTYASEWIRAENKLSSAEFDEYMERYRS